MKNLSKLSLKKALTRDDLRKVKGEGSNCYCQDFSNGWKPGFTLSGSCKSNSYPATWHCHNV